MNKYVIVSDRFSDYNDTAEFEASSLKDLFAQFAEYNGDDYRIHLKAMNAMETVEDFVDLWDKFSSTRISAIYEISNIIYKENN